VSIAGLRGCDDEAKRPCLQHPSINSKFSQHFFLHFSILPSHVFDDILYLFVFLLLRPILLSCFCIAFPFCLASPILYSVLVFEAPNTFYYPINL